MVLTCTKNTLSGLEPHSYSESESPSENMRTPSKLHKCTVPLLANEIFSGYAYYPYH